MSVSEFSENTIESFAKSLAWQNQQSGDIKPHVKT
jgi:hypothetical protein